jgi:plastocyanin
VRPVLPDAVRPVLPDAVRPVMRPGASRSACLAVAIGVGALLAPASVAEPADGGVRGRVRLGVEGASLADVGPIVVYLEPLAGDREPGSSNGTARIRQRNARFSPGFLAVGVGQKVEMPNDDAIYHNVFSYSKPNEFDLGLYRAGESRSVAFRHPGAVKFYCSIHENMNGTIFVAPSRWFATVSSAGAFELRDVPEGRYRLRTWSERLPATGREIQVRAGQTLELEIRVGEPAAPR